MSLLSNIFRSGPFSEIVYIDMLMEESPNGKKSANSQAIAVIQAEVKVHRLIFHHSPIARFATIKKIFCPFLNFLSSLAWSLAFVSLSFFSHHLQHRNLDLIEKQDECFLFIIFPFWAMNFVRRSAGGANGRRVGGNPAEYVLLGENSTRRLEIPRRTLHVATS